MCEITWPLLSVHTHGDEPCLVHVTVDSLIQNAPAAITVYPLPKHPNKGFDVGAKLYMGGITQKTRLDTAAIANLIQDNYPERVEEYESFVSQQRVVDTIAHWRTATDLRDGQRQRVSFVLFPEKYLLGDLPAGILHRILKATEAYEATHFTVSITMEARRERMDDTDVTVLTRVDVSPKVTDKTHPLHYVN